MPVELGPLFTELNTRRLGPVRRYFLRHPVTTDVLVAGWFAVPALVAIALDADHSRPLMLAFVAVGAAALMWRRRRPVWTAGAIGFLGAGSLVATGTFDGFDVALALVVYAVAATRPPKIAWLTLVALCLVVGGAGWVWENPSSAQGGSGLTSRPGGAETLMQTRISSLSSILILTLAAMAIGTAVRNRRGHVCALIDRANGLAIERDHQVLLAAAAERARIAREMHDVVAHSLSVMIALADGAGVALDRSPDRAREAVAGVSATGRTALADMRRVLGILRDPQAPLGPQPGGAELAELVEGFRGAGLPVRTTFAGSALPPDAGLQLTVYRIVQESLTNALRHAVGAGPVDVVVAVAPGRVEITVTDDGGVGARPGAGGTGGKGLIGMRERAAVYGGVVDAGPYGTGWRTRATLSWTRETA